MKSGDVFKRNGSQAVRLPKELAFPESVKRVEIVPLGAARLIVPEGQCWDRWFAEECASDEFMVSRDQP